MNVVVDFISMCFSKCHNIVLRSMIVSDLDKSRNESFKTIIKYLLIPGKFMICFLFQMWFKMKTYIDNLLITCHYE